MNIVLLGRMGKTLSTFSLICLLTCLLPGISRAQGAEPQREQLLNGLRILLISRPGDQNVLLKLRIHSGAAFDTAGKAGTMALLGDILFPDAATHDYFTEEMGGRLEVETNYDGIDLTLQGHAADYDRIVDILRAALVTTQITPENVAKIREARIKALAAVQPTAANVADRMIAELWYAVQTDPYYRDSTTFLITTDHGRGWKPNKWTTHGFWAKGSGDIWLAMLGPDISPEGELKGRGQVYQKQLAATMAALLGDPSGKGHPPGKPIALSHPAETPRLAGGPQVGR